MITTHVLDTAYGEPGRGIGVVLSRLASAGSWETVGEGTTDADGRLRSLVSAETAVAPGVYRLVFDTASYFARRGVPALYPEIIVVFETAPGQAHYHVPLLLSPFGYTTYRGT